MIALSEDKGRLLEQEIAPSKGSSQERCEILVSHEMQCLVELWRGIQYPLGVGGVEMDVPVCAHTHNVLCVHA